MSPELSLLLAASLVPASVVFYIVVGVLPPWWAARGGSEPLGFFDVLRMRFAGVNAWWVVKVVTAAQARGETVTYQKVADAYLDGVDLRAVYAAMQLTPSDGSSPAPFEVLADRFRHGGPSVKEPEEDEIDEEEHDSPESNASGDQRSDER